MEVDYPLFLPILDVLAHNKLVCFRVHLEQVGRELTVESYRGIFLLCDRSLLPRKGLLANQPTHRQLFHCGRGRSASQGKVLFGGNFITR